MTITATAIADYAVGARPGVPVALPLEWRDLKGLASGSPSPLKVTDATVVQPSPVILLERLPTEHSQAITCIVFGSPKCSFTYAIDLSKPSSEPEAKSWIQEPR